MRRLLLILPLLGLLTAMTAAPTVDAAALLLLTQRRDVARDARGMMVFNDTFASESGDPSERVDVDVEASSTGPCRYALQVRRTRWVGGARAGSTWSRMLVDFIKATRIEFKPLYDDHGPDSYLILGRPGLMCVRDAVMADCADRITVERDPLHPFVRAEVQQAFDRMHLEFCPGTAP